MSAKDECSGDRTIIKKYKPIRFLPLLDMPSLTQRIMSNGFFNTLALLITFIRDSTNLYNSLQFGKIRIFTSCDIGIKMPNTTIIPHPLGIVIGQRTEMGENIKINQNVTVAGPVTIQDNVKIGAGAVVIGDITLHQGCRVGANSVVLNDVRKDATVVGAPATEVNK